MSIAQSLKTKIVTPQYEATRDWYRDLLGLVVVEEWDEPGDRGCILALEADAGEALLEIYDGGSAADFAGLSLQFRVTDVDAFDVPNDTRFDHQGPVDRPWGSRYMFFRDPNGISVVVFSGTSL